MCACMRVCVCMCVCACVCVCVCVCVKVAYYCREEEGNDNESKGHQGVGEQERDSVDNGDGGPTRQQLQGTERAPSHAHIHTLLWRKQQQRHVPASIIDHEPMLFRLALMAATRDFC